LDKEKWSAAEKSGEARQAGGPQVQKLGMAPNGKSGRGKGGRKIGNRMSDIEMIKVLQERIAAETPPPGTNPLADKMSTDAPIARRFDQVLRACTFADCCLCALLFVPVLSAEHMLINCSVAILTGSVFYFPAMLSTAAGNLAAHAAGSPKGQL
jgi:hypothetical protein